MVPDWAALLIAFVGGSLMATVVSAFVRHRIFHPVISVRLDEHRGSYTDVMDVYSVDAKGNPLTSMPHKARYLQGQDAIPDTSAHAAPRLRLCPSQRRPRHTGATGLARAQEHPTHRSVHRAGPGSVQGLLALIDRRSRHAISSNGIYGISTDGLLRLDVGGPDHLAPLLGFLGNEFPEIGRRA
jgi:hypothetical protein